jgi:hypothetical protein
LVILQLLLDAIPLLTSLRGVRAIWREPEIIVKVVEQGWSVPQSNVNVGQQETESGIIRLQLHRALGVLFSLICAL